VNDSDEEMVSALHMLSDSKIYSFEPINPTAEVMAKTLFDVESELVGPEVVSIRMWEGLNSYAEYSPNPDHEVPR
jgi:hypothetical protein